MKFLLVCLTLAANAAAQSVVVFEGDSITAGYGVAAGMDWPAQAMSLSFFSGKTKYNYAVPGSVAADLVSRYDANVKPKCQAAGGAYLFVFGGTNDATSWTPQIIYDRYSPYWSQAKADGCTVIVITVPDNNADSSTESIRTGFNALILGSAIPNKTIDLAAVMPAYTNLTYYQADGTHPNATGQAFIASTVNAAMPSPPSITTTSLPGGIVTTAYSSTLTATGTAPITWSVISGSLPAWASLNTSTGAITGTPNATGTTSFTVQASNTAGTASKALSIAVSPVSKGNVAGMKIMGVVVR